MLLKPNHQQNNSNNPDSQKLNELSDKIKNIKVGGNKMTTETQNIIFKLAFEASQAKKADKSSLSDSNTLMDKLNKILEKRWHVVVMPSNHSFEYAVIADENDHLGVEFTIDKETFLIFKTQLEKEGQTQSGALQQMQELPKSDVILQSKAVISDVQLGKVIDKNLRLNIEQIISKYIQENKPPEHQICLKIRKDLDEQIYPQWHVFGMDKNGYSLSIYSDENDEFYYSFSYQSKRYMIVKTPPERED